MEDEEEWVRHVLDELVPMVQDSVVTISIVPRNGVDVKFAVELGVSIMLDKPIILAVPPGAMVPDHLRRVADDIVDMSVADVSEAFVKAMSRLLREGDDRADPV